MQPGKILASILFGCLLTASSAQSLSSNNFSYWYDVNNEIDFVMTSVVRGGQVQVYYQLTANRKEYPISIYKIEWQRRDDYNDREEAEVLGRDSIIQKTDQVNSGVFTCNIGADKWFLLAKVTNTAVSNAFQYYRPIESDWPVNQLPSVNGAISGKRFSAAGTPIHFNTRARLYAFVYKRNFDAAEPPFSDTKPSDPFLIADSTFSFFETFTPKTQGLYLIQEDTTSVRGVTFLVKDANYPKYTRVSLLAPPLIYIAADDEFLKLTAANNEKAAFDKVILEITNDKERARSLMRSYFQRVEIANRYFTDYKEGWKTDRGMLYLIYGKPDEVSRTNDAETWFYEGRNTKFEFKKTKSIFSPENYKLERDSKYMPEWFSMVDLWRKGRY